MCRGVWVTEGGTMPAFAPSPEIFELILKHLVNMEDRSAAGLDWNVEDPAFRLYIERLDKLVRSARVTPGGSDRLPFVIIGSVVDVEVLGRSGSYWVRVVPPIEADEAAGRVSCFSPAGRELLLKEVGASVGLPWEKGVCHCKIRAVTLPGRRG